MWNDVKTQTIVGLLVAALATAFGVFYDWVRGWALVSWWWSGLFVTSPVSRLFFWFLVLAACIPSGILVVAAIRANSNPHESDFLSFYRYGMYWRWTWFNSKPWAITAMCPNCFRDMRYSFDRHSIQQSTHFICQACPHIHLTLDGDPEETDKKIRIEIGHAVRTKAWASEVPARLKNG